MLIQTTLQLVGTSAVIASAIIFVCRPVLIGAIQTMRAAELPNARVIFVGLWALAAVATTLWFVASAAVALHDQHEPEPPLHASAQASQTTRVVRGADPGAVRMSHAIDFTPMDHRDRSPRVRHPSRAVARCDAARRALRLDTACPDP